MIYVLLLNGAMFSGKDFIGDVLSQIGWNKCQFKEQLYVDTAEYFGVDLEWFKAVATDRIRKEIPTESLTDLNGKIYSPRQALIHVSENVVKPVKGKDWYGRVTVDNYMKKGFNVVTDSGFREEAEAVVKKVGAENVILVHLEREGCSFNPEKDSRSYIDLSDLGVQTISFKNSEEISAKQIVKYFSEIMIDKMFEDQ